MRKLVTICALVLCACLVLGHTVWARGKIVVSNDEWPLSETGFSQAPDAATFARNIAAWFTGGQPGDFLVYSTNFSLTEFSPDPSALPVPSPLCPTLIAARHTCTVNPSLPFDLPTLQGFNGVFLAGKVNGGVPDNTVLIEYVEHGGNVYLAGGTGMPGGFRDASEEAAAWNPLLNHFGLAFEGSTYNGVSGTLKTRPLPYLFPAGASTLPFRLQTFHSGRLIPG
jgi:hypothetical protein